MNSEPLDGSLFIPREWRFGTTTEGSAPEGAARNETVPTVHATPTRAQPFEPAVMVSRPCACGPVSCRRSRMANANARKPRTLKIHIMGT